MWFQLGHPNCSPPQLDHIVGLATPLHGNVTVCSCGGQSSFMVVHQCLQFYRIEMISFVDVKGMLKRVQKLVFFSPLHTFWHCRLFTVRIGTGQSFQLHKLRYFPCEICFFTGSPGATQTQGRGHPIQTHNNVGPCQLVLSIYSQLPLIRSSQGLQNTELIELVLKTKSTRTALLLPSTTPPFFILFRIMFFIKSSARHGLLSVTR